MKLLQKHGKGLLLDLKSINNMENETNKWIGYLLAMIVASYFITAIMWYIINVLVLNK